MLRFIFDPSSLNARTIHLLLMLSYTASYFNKLKQGVRDSG